MGENTKIEWADHTASFWEGCVKIAPGCLNCFAEAFEKRVGNDVWGKLKPRKWTKGGPALVRKLNRKAAKAGRIDTVFINDLADFFEDFHGRLVDHLGRQVFTINGGGDYFVEGEYPECRAATMSDLRADAFRLFDECQNLIFMLLTKRPENIRRMWVERDFGNEVDDFERMGLPRRVAHDLAKTDDGKRSNVWLGTSCSDQETADAAIPELLKCRDLSPVLFVSAEPLIGPVDMSPWLDFLDLCIVGGETGPKARPCDVDNIRDIVRQCAAADVPAFVKQWGSFPYVDQPPSAADMVGHPLSYRLEQGKYRVLLKHPKGGDITEWSEDLQVRQIRVKQLPEPGAP